MSELVAFNVPEFSDIQCTVLQELLKLCLDEQASDIWLLW